MAGLYIPAWIHIHIIYLTLGQLAQTGKNEDVIFYLFPGYFREFRCLRVVSARKVLRSDVIVNSNSVER